jgi:hypothetical protein
MPTGDRALFRSPAGGLGRRAAASEALASQARASGETRVPVAYKPGWARPKKKVSVSAAPKGRAARPRKPAGAAARPEKT